MRALSALSLSTLVACATPTTDLSGEVNGLSADVAALQDANGAQDDALADLQGEDVDLGAAIGEAADASTVTALDARVAALEAAGYATRSYVDDAIAALDAAVTAAGYATQSWVLDEIASALGDTVTELADLQDRLTDVETAASDLDGRTSGLEGRADAGEVRLDGVEADLPMLDERIDGLEVASVPVGTVVDWYRPSVATPLPEGWALLDGAVLDEPLSPYDGVQLPDMTGKFTRGVENQDDIGIDGGSDTHEHLADITHNHDGYTTDSGAHNHLVMSWDESTLTWRDGYGSTIKDYSDGYDDDTAGSGLYPITKTAADGATQEWQSSWSGVHAHDVYTYEYSADTICETELNVPVYVGFLKIMRIF